MRFLFCWQIAHPLMYCSIQAHPPSQQKWSRTFLMVSSHPGCAANPSWYACMMRRWASSSGGTIVFQFSSNHRPWLLTHRCCPRLASNHGWYYRCVSASTPSINVGSFVSATLRNALLGRSDSCRSPCSHSLLHGRDSASARVLFFPATWRILKL